MLLCDGDGCLTGLQEVRRDIFVVVDHGPDISLVHMVTRLHLELHTSTEVQLVTWYII